MTQPGYQEGSEPMWWWKVALHLDEAQLALANAMAHNLDDPRPVFALQDQLREGQAILLAIFRAKGLLPGSSNGKMDAPIPVVPVSPPATVVGTSPSPPGAELQPLAAEEPAVPEADHVAISGPEQPPAIPPSPEAAVTAEPPPAHPAGSGAEGSGG